MARDTNYTPWRKKLRDTEMGMLNRSHVALIELFRQQVAQSQVLLQDSRY